MSFDEVFSGTMTEVKEFLTSDKIDRSMILNRVFDDRRQQLIYLVGVTHKKTKEEKLEELKQQRRELRKEMKRLDRKIEMLSK